MLSNWQKKEETKKSKVFTREEVDKFFEQAPDDHQYLLIKCALVLALHGMLRISELTSFDCSYITIKPEIKAVQGIVERKKNNGPKANTTFLVVDEKYKSKLETYINILNSSVTNTFSYSLTLLFASHYPYKITFHICSLILKLSEMF